jgi:hypothetical protein
VPDDGLNADGGSGAPPGGVPMPMPQIPEQTGNVDLDEKTREVLMGLGNKVERHTQENLLTPGRAVPDLTVLYKETVEMLNSMDRFVRDSNGRFYEDGIPWDELVKEIEPMFVKIQAWQGIFQVVASSMDIGRMLMASLHADIIDNKEFDLRKLVPEEMIQLFRVNYESKFLRSMANAFPDLQTNPQEQQGPGGTIRMCSTDV